MIFVQNGLMPLGKIHIVSLPYDLDFKEKNIPTKARPIQMNKQHLD